MVGVGIRKNSKARSGQQLQFEIIESFVGFNVLSREWDDLLLKSEQPTIFLSWAWMSTWLDVYWEESNQLFVVEIRLDGELVGIGPFYIKSKRYPLLGEVKQLCFIGTGEDEQDSVCTEYLDLICSSGNEIGVSSAVIEAFVQCSDRWHVASFSNVLEGAAVATHLIPLMNENGLVSEMSICGFRYSIQLPNVWDDYLNMIPPGLKKKILYKRRKISRIGVFTEKQVSSDEELERAQESLVKLHGERWQSKGQEGVFTSGRFLAFHKKIMRTFLSKQILNLRVCSVDNKVVAVIYNFRFAGVDSYYQSGISVENHLRNFSPGMVAHSYAIEAAIDVQCHEYDFMKGKAESYKQEYCSERHPMMDVDVFNSSLSGKTVCYLNQAIKVLRKGKQRVLVKQ